MQLNESPRDALAQRVRVLLDPRDSVREIRMFGGVSFMVNERLAVSAGAEGVLLVCVDPSRYDELSDRGAVAAVMRNGREMGRGWLSVPAPMIEHADELAFWVGVGIDAR
ncbi:MAG: TfoX/Sxy family protein [Microbacteriaceae bacterium]